jgi:hypothetical protein
VVGGSLVAAGSVTRHEVAQVLAPPNGRGFISDDDMCECIFGGSALGGKPQV